MLLRKHPEDTYEGKCPYHKTCLEGLAAGPAIEARWGKKGIELADKKEVWEMEAYYIEAEDLQEGTYEKLLYPMQ